MTARYLLSSRTRLLDDVIYFVFYHQNFFILVSPESDFDSFLVLKIVKLSLIIVQALLYWKIWDSAKKQTDKMKKQNAMSKKQLNKRYRKNAISFKSQAIGFAIDLLLYLGIVIFHLVSRFHTTKESYLILSVALFSNSISNVALFIASPELRRHYFGDDNVWIPQFR